jgi:hypothetical protein
VLKIKQLVVEFRKKPQPLVTTIQNSNACGELKDYGKGTTEDFRER